MSKQITTIPSKINSTIKKVGYIGGISYNRKNKNYEEVGKKIKKMGHFPVFEHLSITLNFYNVSRLLLFEFTKSRNHIVTANSQRRIVSNSSIPEYKKNKKVKYLYTMYNKELEKGTHKQKARFLLPMCSLNSFVATFNLRELNRLIQQLSFIDTKSKELKKIIKYLKKKLNEQDAYFNEDILPANYFSIPENKKIFKNNVTLICGNRYNFTFNIIVPLALYMQIIKHRSLNILDINILNDYMDYVKENIDVNKIKSNDPYLHLNGQLVQSTLTGPPHAWKHFLNTRLKKSTQKETRNIANNINNIINKIITL